MALEYAPEVGSLEPEVYEWRDKIQKEAKENIKPYYKTEDETHEILNSAVTYIIECDACGGDIPLTKRWWVNKTSNGGDAIRPVYNDGSVKYEHVKVQDVSDEFDPNDAPVTRRKATCPHCDVTSEEEQIQEKIAGGKFKYSVYAVNYETQKGDWHFRGGSEVDEKGMQKAAKRVDSDFELMTFLTEPIDVSSRTNDPKTWGMDEWRDIFTPRQLITHYEYCQAYKKYANEIRESYTEQKAKAILTLLTFPICKSVDHNSRLSVWRDSRGYGANIFGENNFSQKKMFVDNNLTAPRRGFINNSDHAISSYEDLAVYVSGREASDITTADGADLSKYWEPESVDIAVVDPPYYDSIMYGEMSDLFYVVQKELLEDDFPSLFDSKLTNKDDEAVANPYRFDGIAEGEQSKDDLADEFYEQKMEEIFSETHNLLSSEGVVTVMFTHRDMEAWDTLTTGLINSGFTITATHPIKTEMKDRVGLRDKASADSSILLIGRKRSQNQSKGTTLWEDVQEDFQRIAEEEAKSILDSGYTISKTDMAISAYGPTLQRFAEEYPVVNKKGERIKPREALAEARKAVTSVIAERFLNTKGVDELDSLTRWYILAWLTYENNTFPYDEGRQLGVAAGVDIDDIKRPTKLWRGGQEIELQNHSERVQDIVMLQNDSVDDPSSRKYPTNPTDTRFAYTIDAIHSALHVYEREGAKAAWDWLTERNLKSDSAFEIAVTALLEVLPDENDMHKTLIDLISGETGEYLDINVDHIDMSGVDRQTSLGDHTE
ncbi:DUF1156 domain-containing protein [Natronomonas moolapensis]|uniref:DUF1156 domain-containing protein n=1 Tax=Natronomonas moolapensis TaxID=416273 RepID=UPI000A4EFEDD|nr:DUF1156 domain-containing protein [Natronomonas moolapensis]